MDGLPTKIRNGARPKLMSRNVRLHCANFPGSRKPAPEIMRYLSSDSATTVSASDKELCLILDLFVAGEI